MSITLTSTEIILVAALIAALLVPQLLAKFRSAKSNTTSHRASSPTSISEKEKAQPRAFGVWSPVPFQYPKFEPWHSFDIFKTKPVPYRPFRWGPNYPINLGIRPMNWPEWIELDNHLLHTLEIRKERTRTRGDKAVKILPGAEKAALEVCTELASYLSFRYPHIYRVTRVNDGGGLGEPDSLVGPQGGRVKTIEFLPTGDKYDLEVECPMKVAGLLVADDLAIMMEKPDGQYYFQAGSICTAGFWRLEDKIGQPLAYIHESGKVPKFKEKLQFSMERFFQKLKVDRPVVRNNYFFQIDDSLAWSDRTIGPEEIYDQGTKGPKQELLADSSDPRFRAPKPTDDPERVWFRTERQTLRRLPKTGAVLFTIRTYFHPIKELVQEPGVPGRMASGIRSWPKDVDEYKGGELYNDTLLSYLDKMHSKQVEAGLDLDKLGQQYPY